MSYPIHNPITAIDVAADWQLNLGTYPVKILTVPALCTQKHNFAHHPIVADFDFAQYDLVVISDIEMHTLDSIASWAESLGCKKWIAAVGGLHHHEKSLPNTVYRPWWCYNFLKFNEFLPYTQTHRFKFDMLLGARRPHRDFMMLKFYTSGLDQQSICTYRDIFPGAVIDEVSEKVHANFAVNMPWPYTSPNLDPAWEVTVDAGMSANSVSKHAPWQIYQQTSYSVVCETIGPGGCFFMSEKTTKAMLAKRVFVPVSCWKFVEYLRDLGFQTFDHVIDYSWDNIKNDVDRWQKCFEQIQLLADMDPVEVYQKTQEQRQHNHDQLYRLREKTQQQMRELFDRTVQEIVESKA